MMDANQAMVVAYTTSQTGEIFCAEHAEEAYGDEIRQYVEDHELPETGGFSFDLWKAFDAAGLGAISRFDIDEMESQRLYDLEGEELVTWLVGMNNLEWFAADLIDAISKGESGSEIVEEAWTDSRLAKERCDADGEVI